MSLPTHPRSALSSRIPPAPRLLTRLRPSGSFVLHRWFDLTIVGADRVPDDGPVILAANHLGVLDGPLIVITAPRPTVALAKAELFRGMVGRALARLGQLPVDRSCVDVGAVRRCTELLTHGHALTIFPEGRRAAGDMTQLMAGTAYLGLVTGAPIVPVTLLGTRLPGQNPKQVPGRGSAIHIEYGAPITDLPQVAWPRTADLVREWNAELARRLSGEVRRVELSAGMRLPAEPLEVQSSSVAAI